MTLIPYHENPWTISIKGFQENSEDINLNLTLFRKKKKTITGDILVFLTHISSLFVMANVNIFHNKLNFGGPTFTSNIVEN